METNSLKLDKGISLDNFNYIDGVVSQVKSLTTFIVGCDGHKSISKDVLSDLLGAVSGRIEALMNNSADMYLETTIAERLWFEQLLAQVKSICDALRLSDNFDGLAPDDLINIIWLVDSILENVMKELSCWSVCSVEQSGR